jgi:ABC-type bacteriocin/lantibiotic exporter with double-glycine peptidase domain
VRAKRRGIKVVSQRKPWDCGLACLAMLTGEPYGDIVVVARDLVDPIKARRRGLIIPDMLLVAGVFGMRLRPIRKQKDYLVGRTGILGLVGGDLDRSGHWVMLKAGAIVEPDASPPEVWSVLDYLAEHKARLATLLVEDR